MYLFIYYIKSFSKGSNYYISNKTFLMDFINFNYRS